MPIAKSNSSQEFALHCGDAVDWLATLPSQSVDLVITDPPYESLEKHRQRGTTTRLKMSNGSSNEWFSIFPNHRFKDLFEQLFRVQKKDTHFYLFCDPETMFIAKPIAEQVGYKFWKPLIWDKKTIGMGYHYRARYECILFFEKGKRKLNSLSIPDVIEARRVHRGYPAEKPPQVAEILISQSSNTNELIIDPFMGSGSTGVASVRQKRRFSGCDIFQKAVDLSRERLLASDGVEFHTLAAKDTTDQKLITPHQLVIAL